MASNVFSPKKGYLVNTFQNIYKDKGVTTYSVSE